jgi:hypothetical protein
MIDDLFELVKYLAGTVCVWEGSISNILESLLQAK